MFTRIKYLFKSPYAHYDSINPGLIKVIISNIRHITFVANEHNTKVVYSTFAAMYGTSEKKKKKLEAQMKEQFGKKPNWPSAKEENIMCLLLASFNKEIVKLGEELNIPIADVSTINKKAENFNDEIHQSPKGNKLQAEKISQILISNNMIHKELNSFEMKK